jgi:hypothetical protein
VTALGGGRSNAGVFKVRLGDADVGVFKVFPSGADARAEARAIEAIAGKHLQHLKVVGAKGEVPVETGGTLKGGLLMEVAPGKTVKQMLDALPESGPMRDSALAEMKAAARHVGRALAELHKSFETGREMTHAAKEAEARNTLDKLAALHLGGKLEPAVYQAIRAKVIQAIADFYAAPVPETVYHGDANLGNFAIGPGGQVTTFDVGTMQWAFGFGGKPQVTGAADVARFGTSFASDAPGKLTATELADLRGAFNRAYFDVLGKAPASMAPAIKFYQIDMELGVMRGQARAGQSLADALGRLLGALDLPPAIRFKTDAELTADLDTTLRPGETNPEGTARVEAARTEKAYRTAQLAEIARLISRSRITNAERQRVINTLRTPTGQTRGPLEGYVLDTALAENQRAISEIVTALRAHPPDAIVGIERGGGLLTDVIGAVDATLAPKIRRIPMHRAPEGSPTKFDVPRMRAEFQAIIDSGAKRIVIVDAYMGGRTARELRDVVLRPLARGGVEFEMRWVRELMGFEDRPAAGLSARGGIRSYTHDVRMAVGDDMQIVLTPGANDPITIFRNDGSVVRVIQPGPGKTTRDVLIELLSQRSPP